MIKYVNFSYAWFLWILLGLLPHPGHSQTAKDIIWLEAEKFDDMGGWTNDWQFIDQMGSPYLFAIGLGTPVKDAVTSVKSAKPGRYRLWVRTLDWKPDHHPGKFEIHVNGKKLKKTFGASGREGWTWENGGVVPLLTTNEIRLKDLTGYYGRVDAIALSPDLNWIPPADVDKIAALRLQFGGISKEITDMGSYDVVVVGGGVAGTLAAVAAAREGAKTVLIQNRGELGGNTSHEIMVPPVGTRTLLLTEEEKKYYFVRETGLLEEICAYGSQLYFTYGKLYPSRLLRLVEGEPNLDLFLYTHAIDVEMEGTDRIKSVIALTVPEGKRLRFSGKIFMDCTGHGVVGLKAGAEYMYGRESKAMYNETKAPDLADTTTLGSSLKYWFTKYDTPQPFTAPAWIYSFPSCDDFSVGRHPNLDLIDRQWMISLGGTDKTYNNGEAVRDDLFRLVYGIWDHVKNHCKQYEEEAKYLKLAWVSHVVGVRESYRLKGDYVMTEHDITQQPLLPDRIAFGGWGMDDHPSEGFFKKTHYNMYSHGGLMHSIPYRSLYSRNISNLMMAGRNISVTHMALTATRVMLTCGVIGQAAGMAAGMAIQKETNPRGIYESHMAELQQKLLKTGAYLIELPNQDPNDLALSASVNASSALTPASEVINGYSRPRLTTAFPHAEFKLNAWTPDPAKEGPHWISLSWPSPQTFNVVHVVFINRDEMAPARFRLEYLNGGRWETIRVVENPRRFRRLVLPAGKIESSGFRVVLDEVEPRTGICEIRVYNEPPHVVQQAARVFEMINQPDGETLLPWEKLEEAPN